MLKIFSRDGLVTPSKVNKFFDVPQYSRKIVTILDDVSFRGIGLI